MKHLNLSVVPLALALSVAACGGGSGSGTSPPVTPPVTPIPPVTPVPPTVPDVPPVSVESAGQAYRAGEAFVSGGVRHDGAVLTGFAAVGARAIFTVRARAAGTYPVNLNYANAQSGERTLTLYVNGLKVGPAALARTGGAAIWGSKATSVALRAGLNTITYRYDSGDSGGVALRYVALEDGVPIAERGATLSYQEYEAEDGATNGVAAGPATDYKTVEAQASGRRMVTLKQAGAYVDWVARQAANSLVVRYNMPDAPGGGGTDASLSLYVDGVKVKKPGIEFTLCVELRAVPLQ